MTGGRMRPLVLVQGWKAEPVRIAGPVTPEHLLDRLEAEVWPVSLRHPYGGGVRPELRGQLLICGQVHDADIRIYRTVPGRSRPFLRRQLFASVEAGERGGSVIQGQLRLSRGLCVYLAVWLVILGSAWAFTVGLLIATALRGDGA